MKYLRNGYIAKFFKDLYFIPALFIASILSTIFIACEGYGIFDNLVKGSFSHYLISTASFFTAIYLIYALAESKNKRLNIVDAMNFAIILSSIAYVLFVIFGSKKFSIIKFVIPGALIIIMVVVAVIRNVYFNPYDDKGKIYFTKNSINAYYHTLTKNHSFFGIYLFSVAITCIAYLVIRSGYTVNLSSSRIILPFVVLGLFLASLILNSISKKISLLDASVLGMTMSLPPILFQIIFLVPSTVKQEIYFSYWLIILGVVLILTLLRYIFFDISKIGKNTSQTFSENTLVNYFKRVSYKYGIGIIVTVAFASVVILFLMLTFADITKFFVFAEGQLRITFNLFPALIINLLFIGTILLGAFLSLVNLKAVKITFADFLMLTNLIFSVVASLVFILQKTYDWRIYSLGALFIYSLTITIIRIIKSSPKKID